MDVSYREGNMWMPSMGYPCAAPEWRVEDFLIGYKDAGEDGDCYSEGDSLFSPSNGMYAHLRYKLQLGLDGGKLFTTSGYPIGAKGPVKSLGDIAWSGLEPLVPSGGTTSVIRNGVPQSEGHFSLRGSSTDTINVAVMGKSFIMAKVDILAATEWKDSSVGFNHFVIKEETDRLNYIRSHDLDHKINIKAIGKMVNSCIVPFYYPGSIEIDAPGLDMKKSIVECYKFKTGGAFKIENSCIKFSNVEVDGGGYIKNSNIGELGGIFWEDVKLGGTLELDGAEGDYDLSYGGGEYGFHGFKVKDARYTKWFHAYYVNQYWFTGVPHKENVHWDIEIINDRSETINHINGQVELHMYYNDTSYACPCTGLYFKLILKNCRFPHAVAPASQVTISLPCMTTRSTADSPHIVLVEDEDCNFSGDWDRHWHGTIFGYKVNSDPSLEDYGIPTNKIDVEVWEADTTPKTPALSEKLEGEHDYTKLFLSAGGGGGTNNGAEMLYVPPSPDEPGDLECAT